MFTEHPRVAGPCIETQIAPLTDCVRDHLVSIFGMFPFFFFFFNSDFAQISRERAEPHAQELTATSHLIPTNAKGSASCSASLRLRGVSSPDT